MNIHFLIIGERHFQIFHVLCHPYNLILVQIVRIISGLTGQEIQPLILAAIFIAQLLDNIPLLCRQFFTASPVARQVHLVKQSIFHRQVHLLMHSQHQETVKCLVTLINRNSVTASAPPQYAVEHRILRLIPHPYPDDIQIPQEIPRLQCLDSCGYFV